ncbi:uncharacterized protein C8orf88 homolog isoform X2 [Lepisosteus oculatus]|uniref:uncharacterized protein C8orf88 homolog isoform X2 n=1 Tax=Lepisosteus oculatus TaxID=7918 RepID=UPI0035F50655
MEVSGIRRRICKSLQPARPLRRLSLDPEAERKRTEFSKDCSRIEASLVNGTSVEQLCSVLLLQSPSPATPQKERICYSSEFLKRFANLPIAKTKPKYLPDISIVLQESDFACSDRFFSTSSFIPG